MAKEPAKTDAAIGPDSIDDVMLETMSAPDRLTPMLFLAALIHGILIIGITFNAVIGDEVHDAISLEVTIVADPDPNVLEVARAEYLAQANQEGAGNTQEQARPSARVESMVPVDNMGSPDGASPDDTRAIEEYADQTLTAQAEQDFNVLDKPREEPSPDESVAAQLESGIQVTMPLPQDLETDTAIHDDNPRELVTSVDTKESKVAGYLSRWKSKIETVGIKYFPDQRLIDGMTGSPTLEVTITSSGQLQDAVIRRSSGSRALDLVALRILHRAAPFDPFPEAIRVDYDQLRFAYKWQFNYLGVQATARSN